MFWKFQQERKNGPRTDAEERGSELLFLIRDGSRHTRQILAYTGRPNLYTLALSAVGTLLLFDWQP